MPLKSGIDLVEGLELFDRKEPTQGKHGIESDGRMTLAENEAISIGFVRFEWIDSQAVEIEIDQNIGDREGTADMPSAGMEYRTENELPGSRG